MKKILMVPALCAALFLASCNGSKNNSNNSSSDTTTTAGTNIDTSGASANVPVATAPQITNTISLTGNDQRQYSDTLFLVKAGQKITLTMQNIGNMPAATMSHDVIILKPGSSVSDFGNAATSAGNGPDALNKLSANLKKEIIAHTKMLSAGQSDQITFTLPKPGTYPFLCSFPAHYLTMHGEIIAK
ncbi:MAG: azurin [Chitinophagaceae bacterium]|nr:MAG: azurin [Chitinophagaceae bacterium]